MELSEALLPDLFRLATVSHSPLSEVRRLILQIPGDRLEILLGPLIEELVAELLATLKSCQLLNDLVAQDFRLDCENFDR
ncbi:hypothetical protein [Crossiella sp. NPDC003009]